MQLLYLAMRLTPHIFSDVLAFANQYTHNLLHITCTVEIKGSDTALWKKLFHDGSAFQQSPGKALTFFFSELVTQTQRQIVNPSRCDCQQCKKLQDI